MNVNMMTPDTLASSNATLAQSLPEATDAAFDMAAQAVQVQVQESTSDEDDKNVDSKTGSTSEILGNVSLEMKEEEGHKGTAHEPSAIDVVEASLQRQSDGLLVNSGWQEHVRQDVKDEKPTVCMPLEDFQLMIDNVMNMAIEKTEARLRGALEEQYAAKFRLSHEAVMANLQKLEAQTQRIGQLDRMQQRASRLLCGDMAADSMQTNSAQASNRQLRCEGD